MFKRLLILLLISTILGCSSLINSGTDHAEKKTSILKIVSLLEKQNYIAMKGYLKDNHFYFASTVNGKNIDFMLDSGASGSFINHSLSQKLKITEKKVKTTSIETQTAFSSLDIDHIKGTKC